MINKSFKLFKNENKNIKVVLPILACMYLYFAILISAFILDYLNIHKYDKYGNIVLIINSIYFVILIIYHTIYGKSIGTINFTNENISIFMQNKIFIIEFNEMENLTIKYRHTKGDFIYLWSSGYFSSGSDNQITIKKKNNEIIDYLFMCEGDYDIENLERILKDLSNKGIKCKLFRKRRLIFDSE